MTDQYRSVRELLVDMDVMTEEQVLEAAENDFEGPVFKAYPLLQEIKHQLLALEADMALLSGERGDRFRGVS
ncbi:MAG: hypothetical protein HC933_11750 [Pleurocapsa sp. SU_196_0]|nr:hypothetical protein [Pleurocapsa sp. SU_196_0]